MRPRRTEAEPPDPLYLRVSARLLGVGVPHDSAVMRRRAASLGLSPEAHRDMAMAAAQEEA